MERYKIIKQLGSGGMGQVYLAEDCRVGRKVAMKIIQPVNLSFGIEMEMLRDLKSELFPVIYDAWIEENRGIIIMEYVEGKTLQEYINARKENEEEQNKEDQNEEEQIEEEQIFEWGRQIAQFLKQIHNLHPKILYRDLKPENIMVLPDKKLKIIDFGAAAIMERDKLNGGKRVGTYGYASPEQWSGQMVDERTDIFSMGAVILDMFRGSCEGIMGSDIRMIEQERYVPEGMKKIILKCLESDAENRYASAEAFLKDWKSYKKAEQKSLIGFFFFYSVLISCLIYAAYVIWCFPSKWKLWTLSISIYLGLKMGQTWYNSRKYSWVQVKSVWCRG